MLRLSTRQSYAAHRLPDAPQFEGCCWWQMLTTPSDQSWCSPREHSGPTLFLLYVNDADTCLSPGTEMAVYADDTTLYSLVRSAATINQQASSLQKSLDALHAWGQKWRVKFEPTKSQYLRISNQLDHGLIQDQCLEVWMFHKRNL